MNGAGAPATSVLRPILDMYLDSPVALVGCHSRGLERPSCELDVVVVSNEKRPSGSIKVQGTYADLVFIDERQALNPSNPEHVVALAYARPVRDSSMLLTTSTAANAAVQSEASKRAASTRLASSLKTLVRADDALSQDLLAEADFWLLASSYEFAYALMYSKELVPSPSHLLSEMRSDAPGGARAFEAFSKGAGLDRATRAGCGTRLEGLTVLHDVIRSEIPHRGRGDAAWSDARLQIVTGKAKELAGGMELAECYSYMGQEIVDYLMAITGRGARRSNGIESLLSGEEKVLGDRLIKQLGISRSKNMIEGRLRSLKQEVSSLARKI